ncbi:hypothetical protein [Campylobacter rectus]
MRLIAIKYDEICRNEDFSMPPNGDEDDFFTHPNAKFQQRTKGI